MTQRNESHRQDVPTPDGGRVAPKRNKVTTLLDGREAVRLEEEANKEAMASASLIGLAGAAFGRRFPLATEFVTIGRAEDECGLVIADSGVSRVHAAIRSTARGHVISDCGSTNGIRVDGSVVDAAELRDGAHIEIGSSILKYVRLTTIERDFHDTLAALARTDELTGVDNRRTLLEYLRAEVARAARHERALSVIAVDIDHFKSVNDLWGHAAGDRVLVAVAERMKSTARVADRVGRIGGEEFVIVTPDTPLLAAAGMAERVRSTVASDPIHIGDDTIRVTASFGVSALGEVPASVTRTFDPDQIARALVEQADKRLYAAKEAGRNRVVCR